MPQLSDPILNEYANFAKTLASESAKIIRTYFRSGYNVEFKADESPVTVADRKAEEVMRTLIEQTFPTHGILGEEHGHHQPDAEFQWVLDPIDGTKSFVSGTYLFGTLIALVQNERPILGIINSPLMGDLLLGVGGQTWLNDQPVSVTSTQKVEDAFLVTTSHTDCLSYRDGAAFNQFVDNVLRYRTWGDCHGYHLVATGGVDIMVDPIMNYWDLMALIPIIEGAGGRITDWYGGDVALSRGAKGAVAANKYLHDEVIRRLNP